MTQKEFATEVFHPTLKANGFMISKKDADDITRIFVESLSIEIRNGKRVDFIGFGHFGTKIKERKNTLGIKKQDVFKYVDPYFKFSLVFKRKIKTLWGNETEGN